MLLLNQPGFRTPAVFVVTFRTLLLVIASYICRYINSLFFVKYEPVNNSFSCLFVGSYENKSCEIACGAMDPTGQTCVMDNKVTWHVNSSRISDTVTVFIPKLECTGSEFCFTAIGKTAAFTIAVEGTFRIGIE